MLYQKGGYLNKSLIATMGISTLIGSFIGGYSSHILSVINIVYGILALLTVILIIFPMRGPIEYNRLLATLFLVVIGLRAGIVGGGVGGAFLLIPVMITILKISTRVTIATSLGVTFISLIGTTFGEVLTGDILIPPAIIVIVASVIASPLGAKLSKVINTKHLRALLAVLIFTTEVKICTDILY